MSVTMSVLLVSHAFLLVMIPLQSLWLSSAVDFLRRSILRGCSSRSTHEAVFTSQFPGTLISWLRPQLTALRLDYCYAYVRFLAAPRWYQSCRQH